MSGVYREIVEPEKIVFTFAWDDEPETLITVTIRPEGNGSKLTFRHEPFATKEARDSHEGGWGECLDKLVAEMAEALSNEEDLSRLVPLRRDQVRGGYRSRRGHQEVQLRASP